jgi:hypothetical protein
MSKIVLEFDGIEDADDARTALDGIKWKVSMWQLDQWLRSQIKYAPDEQSEDTYQAFEECREKLRGILADNNLQLD